MYVVATKEKFGLDQFEDDISQNLGRTTVILMLTAVLLSVLDVDCGGISCCTDCDSYCRLGDDSA
jgi:hypothetical protein